MNNEIVASLWVGKKNLMGNSTLGLKGLKMLQIAVSNNTKRDKSLQTNVCDFDEKFHRIFD